MKTFAFLLLLAPSAAFVPQIQSRFAMTRSYQEETRVAEADTGVTSKFDTNSFLNDMDGQMKELSALEQDVPSLFAPKEPKSRLHDRGIFDVRRLNYFKHEIDHIANKYDINMEEIAASAESAPIKQVPTPMQAVAAQEEDERLHDHGIFDVRRFSILKKP